MPIQCRKSSRSFLTCRQLDWAGPACQPHGAGTVGQMRMLGHPCLPQHGDAVKKAIIPQVCQRGSPGPCLDNRHGGVQCTWVQSRVLAPEVGRDGGLWKCTSTSAPFPSLEKVLPFSREHVEAFGCFVCGAAGRGQQGEHAGGYCCGSLPLAASLTRQKSSRANVQGATALSAAQSQQCHGLGSPGLMPDNLASGAVLL